MCCNYSFMLFSHSVTVWSCYCIPDLHLITRTKHLIGLFSFGLAHFAFCFVKKEILLKDCFSCFTISDSYSFYLYIFCCILAICIFFIDIIFFCMLFIYIILCLYFSFVYFSFIYFSFTYFLFVYCSFVYFWFV